MHHRDPHLARAQALLPLLVLGLAAAAVLALLRRRRRRIGALERLLHAEARLDEAIQETFPASDPIAVHIE